DLPRQRFQRALVIALGLRLRVVEQGQRRDAAAVGDVEQRDLLLALGTFALLDRGCRWRLDAHLLALCAQLGVDLADFGAFLAVRARFLPFAGLLAATPQQLRQ